METCRNRSQVQMGAGGVSLLIGRGQNSVVGTEVRRERMKRRAEADRGLEETGTRMLLVSVRPRLPALARSYCQTRSKAAQVPSSKVRAVAQQARRSCTSHYPQTPEGPWRGND